MRTFALALICLVALGFFAWPVIAYFGFHRPYVDQTKPTAVATQGVDWVSEGKILAPNIVAGPFNIKRKYRSMEGPWSAGQFKVGDLIASGHAELGEDTVHFTENRSDSVQAPSMNGGSAKTGDIADIEGAFIGQRALYWLKGFKIEVLDENGNVMPKGEFICHINVDSNPSKRNEFFPHGERAGNDRVLTITQGQTELRFPKGYGLPVASDEVWKISLQAANRISAEHRKIRHRATFYFIKDGDLTSPITALYYKVPFVRVIVDRPLEEASAQERQRHPFCEVMPRGLNAPNNVIGGIGTEKSGRVTSGHWVVPQGKHEYSMVLNEMESDFTAKDRTIRYGWVHIHPCCQRAVIRECNGKEKKDVVSSSIATSTINGGFLLDKIEVVNPPQGVKLKRDGHYELAGFYDNKTDAPLDSMISMGLYFDDMEFRRPDWALPDKTAAYCGVGSTQCAAKEPATKAVAAPLFNDKVDGPLLKRPVQLRIKTTYGDIRAVIDPALAPKSATYMRKLFLSSAFDGIVAHRYEKNFVVQFDKAYQKPGDVRALPLEVEAQQSGKLRHKRGVLSLSRFAEDRNSTSSSFSILLGDARHLDKEYTIFGYIKDDPATLATLKRMEDGFAQRPPTILGCSTI